MDKKTQTVLSFAALGIAVAVIAFGASSLFSSKSATTSDQGNSTTGIFFGPAPHWEKKLGYYFFFGLQDPDAPASAQPAAATPATGGLFADQHQATELRIQAQAQPRSLTPPPPTARLAIHIEPMEFFPDGAHPGKIVAADSVATENTFSVSPICFIPSLFDFSDGRDREKRGVCPSLYVRDPKNPRFGAAVMPWSLSDYSPAGNYYDGQNTVNGLYDSVHGECIVHKSEALREVFADRRIRNRECFRGVWFFADDRE